MGDPLCVFTPSDVLRGEDESIRDGVTYEG